MDLNESPMNKNSSLIKPQMRKTRLKSEVFEESIRSVCRDDKYDLAKEEYDTSKNRSKRPGSPPVFDESFSDDAPECKSKFFGENCESSTFVNLSGALLNNNNVSNGSLENESTDINNQEMADNLLKTIDTDAIADMLTKTDHYIKGKETNSRELKDEIARKRRITDDKQTATKNPPPNKYNDVELIQKISKNKEFRYMEKCSRQTRNLIEIDNVREFNDENALKNQRKDVETTDSFFTAINRFIDKLALSNLGTDIEFEDENISKKQSMGTESSESPLCNRKKRISLKLTDNQTNNKSLANENQISNHKEVKSEGLSRQLRSSIKVTNNITPINHSPAKENNREDKSPNKVINSPTTKPSEANGLLKYFKAQNKLESNVAANSRKSYKKQENEDGIQPLEDSLDNDVSNDLHLNESNVETKEQDANKMATKRGRGRPRLSSQHLMNTNLPKPGGVKKDKKLSNPTKTQIKHVQKLKHNLDNNVSNQLNLNEPNIESKEEDDNQIPTKRGRGRPRLSTQHVKKTNLSKQIGVHKYTKLRKLTKAQIKKVGERKIPKDRLDTVLNMIDNDSHPIWEDHNLSCNPSIYLYWNPRSSLNSDQNIKLKYARQFLLRRDWINLSKVLGLFNSTATVYYPLLAKYSALLLAHTDKEQFNKFVQHLTKINDSSVIMKKCTNIEK